MDAELWKSVAARLLERLRVRALMRRCILMRRSRRL